MYCRVFGGAHNINILSGDILQVTQNAQIKHKKRKAQENEEIRTKEEKQKRQIEEEEKQKEIIKRVDKNKNALDKTEKQLEQNKKKIDTELEVA